MTTAIWLASAAALATPQTNPGTWIGPDDYPASAVASDKEGATTVALQLDETGRPSACTISASSGSADLDDRTCSLLVARARFNPARDQDGKAVASTYSQRVAWRIPREQLITQGFKITHAIARSDCQVEQYHMQDDELECDPELIDDTAGAYLPSPLDSYKSASVTLAMEIEDSGIAIPRTADEDRVVISRAFVDVSAAGVVTACRSDVARLFQGQPADLCVIAVDIGSRDFDPDPEGKQRTLRVTLEVSGAR